ncbi:MAG: S1C family serine protease [Acidimicrobiia bacterium]
MRRALTFVLGLVLILAGCNGDDKAATTLAGQAPGETEAGFHVVLTDVSDLVEAVEPSVVTVTLTQLRLDELGDVTEVPAGAGTGVVIDADGHVLTNAHVIAGARSVIVVGPDGDLRTAQVVGTWDAEQNNDLALLLLEEKSGLEPIVMGSSRELKVGDPVVAIGNALGRGLSVTVGIVSAKGRDVVTDTSKLEGVLQTDAAINPGNSGGPLLNARGELVGINTAGARQAENIGFAIPVDQALPFVNYVIAEAGQPFIGVGLHTITPQLAAQFGLPVDEGAVITEVFGGGAAADAGLVVGDIVVAVDDDQISSREDLLERVDEAGVGGELIFTLMRLVEDRFELAEVVIEVDAR